jgi:hypothetical protein
MVDDHARELMNKELDGVNSPAESASLSRLLTQDPEAKGSFDDMRELQTLLGRVGTVEPPRPLHARIMNALPAPREQHRAAFSWNRVMDAFRLPAAKPAFVLTLLAGVIVGLTGTLLLTHRISGGDESISQVVGSALAFTPVTELTSVASTHVSVADAEFDLGLRRSSDAILIKIDGSSRRNLLIQVEFPGKELSLNSFHRFGGTGNGFLSSPGMVSLSAEGRTDVGFLFHAQTAPHQPVHVRLFDGPTLLAERTLELGQGN